jgi:hypothetical protein
MGDRIIATDDFGKCREFTIILPEDSETHFMLDKGKEASRYLTYMRPDWYGDSTYGWVFADEHENIEVNDKGGKQSKVPYAFHVMPPKAILAVAETLQEGDAKYGRFNWKLIPEDEHLNHSIGHIYKHLSGDTTEKHLVNAACRALFALEMYLESKND